MPCVRLGFVLQPGCQAHLVSLSWYYWWLLSDCLWFAHSVSVFRHLFGIWSLAAFCWCRSIFAPLLHLGLKRCCCGELGRSIGKSADSGSPAWLCPGPCLVLPFCFSAACSAPSGLVSSQCCGPLVGCLQCFEIRNLRWIGLHLQSSGVSVIFQLNN